MSIPFSKTSALALLFLFNLYQQCFADLSSNRGFIFIDSIEGEDYYANFKIGGCLYTQFVLTKGRNGEFFVHGPPATFPNCKDTYGIPPQASFLYSNDKGDFVTQILNSPRTINVCVFSESLGEFSARYDCGDLLTYVDPPTTTTTTVTTTTTTTTSTTTTTTTTTTNAPTSTCVVKSNIYGRRTGRGILKDCCKTSDDCYGSCKKGICDAEHNPKTTISSTSTSAPTPTGPCTSKSNVIGQKKGNGVLGDCCRNSDDCTGSCVAGKCNAVGNPFPDGSCTSSNYFGKKNGKGPVGVCCKTEADCKNSCVSGKCIS